MFSVRGTGGLLDLPPGPPSGLGGLPFEAAEVDLPEPCCPPTGPTMTPPCYWPGRVSPGS